MTEVKAKVLEVILDFKNMELKTFLKRYDLMDGSQAIGFLKGLGFIWDDLKKPLPSYWELQRSPTIHEFLTNR